MKIVTATTDPATMATNTPTLRVESESLVDSTGLILNDNQWAAQIHIRKYIFFSVLVFAIIIKKEI